MSALLVQIKLADGSIVAGAVHGSGGLVAGAQGHDRIERAIRQASKGRPTGLYEPKAGHARVYRDASALAADNWVDVDLRDAALVSSMEFASITARAAKESK